MRDRLQQTLISVLVFTATLFAATPLYAGEVAKADLDILGLGLEVDRNPVVSAVDVPSFVQTLFGGKSNDEAPTVEGLSAIGELTGPGITNPITLHAVPGRKFAIPALHEKGEYALQNIRLVAADGAFLQQAVPSFAIIRVTDVLTTEVRVRQLTPEELRERGITVDTRNYDVYEYVLIFAVDGQLVEIPYPVIIDKRTHQVMPVTRENPYKLPPLSVKRPPRFVPPVMESFDLSGGGGGGPQEQEGERGGAGPSIPAAIIVPNGFGVLHQFFAVILQVSNTSPEEANIRLDQITARIGTTNQMRVSKVEPPVAIGQPVPIYDASTGTTYLIAGATGNAEWTLEALKAGTHPVDIVVEATYQKPGQEDFKLRGRASTAIVVSDPRFQINFSHPDTVRTDENYTAYAFITNMSSQTQHVMLDMSEIPSCNTGAAVDHICRVEGADITELDIAPGEMVPVPYKLKSEITGHVFAGAGSANDEALSVSVKLHMGVSESGIPLSPATLVMPHYAKYLPADFIAANMQLLGLGYSLATAPLNAHTAKYPRVIKNDIFQRAQEIARAGQRVFVTRASVDTDNPEENRDSYFHLALDLLGNVERVDHIDISPELYEWDQLRRQEKSGRRAAAAMARELEKHGLHNGRTAQQFVDDFAAATSHRNPFLFAWAHGADVAGKTRPYALSVHGTGTGEKLDVPAEETTGWVRLMPYAELTRFDAGSERGEMAIVGRWKETLRVSVIPESSSFTLHLIYPDTANGAQLRTDVQITNAVVGQPMSIDVARGARTLIVQGASGNATVNAVPQTALRVLGAAQDMHLNEQARLVSLLFNRPLKVGDPDTLRDKFELTINVPEANYSITRRNPTGDGPLQIPAAALQQDARLINVTFDKALSINAQYEVAVESLVDLVNQAPFARDGIVPRIDNDEPGAILTGRVLMADNTPVPGAEVELDTYGGKQLEVADAQGRYMYEFVPRNIDKGIHGTYRLRAVANGRETKLEGAVRLVGEVHTVNLVFLGRGTARGQVRYSDGVVLADETVTIGSTLFGQFRTGITDANGNYEVGDLPVGPLTFSVVDGDGRHTYAANVIRTAGEIVTQDLVIERRGFPGLGKVKVTVRRSDTNELVPQAHVGVYTQGYGLTDGYADSNGYLEFNEVPAGLISIIAAHFGISRESVGIELDLRADQTIEQTVIIPVPGPTDAGYATVEGVITRDDPAAPGDRTKDQVVAGAIITIGNLPPVTTNADGTYIYADVPIAASGAKVQVFDQSTGRKGQFTLPTLIANQMNRFSAMLSSSNPEGEATIRVRLTSATGAPVTGYSVFEPGFPPTRFEDRGGGVYELPGVRVPNKVNIMAVPKSPTGPFGDQMTSGTARVDFSGQVAIADLRLPGQGIIITKLELRQPQEACPTLQPCYAPAFGRVILGYSVWDEVEQMTKPKTIPMEADSSTQLNTFMKVPALQDVVVYTDRHPAGHAGASLRLAYEGDVRHVTLRMETIGDVTGRVFAHDRQTPISLARVKLTNGNVVYGTEATKPDGSFRFAGIQANLGFRLVAEYTQDGIYRTGYADGRTPDGGGPVSNLVIVMREQSTIEGQVLDSDDEPVPLARYWARELAWPYTQYGSQTDPLQADINGRFILTNVFTGPFRITAVSPTVQEERGDYQGELRFEGDTSQLQVKVRIGGTGFGDISANVIDSLQAYVPIENAEVTLYRGSTPFDVASSDDRGFVTFHDVPAGSYSLRAYSKTVGRGGDTPSFTLATDGEVHREIVLDFLGKVAGFVTDPENSNLPVKGIPVQAEGNIGMQGVAQRASTDGSGNFSILGVPEGKFKLFAYDYDTGRMAFGPPNLEISKVVQEINNLHLELERTGTLTVKAYLPNDSGGAGELAPLVDVLIEARDYFREAQGNNLTFPKMITRYSYKLTAKELGGEHRQVISGGSFPAGQLTHTHTIVFASTGSVQVSVLDGGGAPVMDAEVTIGGKKLYTPADGVVRLSGVPFGWISVSAKKGTTSASDSGQLQSRTVTREFTLNLGSNASVTGRVEAEEGIAQPSPATRVLMNVTSRLFAGTRRLETLTAADGTYTFTGIPIGGTRLSFLFYGPDDTTIGDEMVIDVPDSTTGVFTVPTAKLDATPPRVLSIDPAPNTTNVAPTANVSVTFSEPIAAAYLTTQYFQLLSTVDGAAVNSTIQGSIRPDGTFIVKLIPPPPPAGQKYPLKSNVLYRVSIVQGMQDTTGNALKATFGSSFTTVNYTEPTVVRVDPPAGEALPFNATFRIKFNKTIDITSLDAGYGGELKLERLDTRNGDPVQAITLSRYLDPADPTVIVAAPTGVAIAEASFYRLTVSGIRDTQTPPNTQKDAKSVDFFSFDTKRPIARIKSPVAAGEKLVSGISYTATVEVVDEITGEPSIDVESVDWFDAEGKFLKTLKTAPYGYTFTAPATTVDTTWTLQVSANDLSLNRSPQLEPFTWDVIPNAAPTNVVVTNQSSSAYPSQKVTSTVAFSDEGVKVTVVLKLKGKRLDGSDVTVILDSKSVERASTTALWPTASFTYSLPLDLLHGTAQIVGEVTDVAKTGTGESPLEILDDEIQPEVTSFLPKAETRYPFPGTYTVEVKVRDVQTGVKSFALSIAGEVIPSASITHTVDNATGIHTYRHTANVKAKNADTRIPIVFTSTDNRDNFITQTSEIIFERVDDATIPQAEWITPLDTAAIPFGMSGWQATLRIRATDDQAVTGVTFQSDQFTAAPATITTPKSGTTNIYEAKVTFKPFDAGVTPAPFVVKAIITDAEPAHTVELPITLTPVFLDTNVPALTQTTSISSLTDDPYINKTLVVRGSGVRVTITVPLALRNLIVLDGATVSTFEETRLDLTVTDNVFIDADSKIDVTDEGYLGGHRTREDSSLSNNTSIGRTLGGTTTGGATSSATAGDGSHAGIGGEELDNTTNATYGSIKNPLDFGSGGSGTGGNGGGVVHLRSDAADAAKFVIAGVVRADGGTGTGRSGAGAGGSVNLDAKVLVTGPVTRITANGGDDSDPTSNASQGGGGGRIAIRVSDRFDAGDLTTLVQTRGGRNGTSEANTYVDGGAGTVFIAGPDATDGELIVSAWDEGYPASTGKVRGTPLGGDLTFDAITVGPRALARFDTSYTVPVADQFKVDPTAVVITADDVPEVTVTSTTPAAGAQVAQSTSIVAKYTAQSLAGVTRARVVLTAQPTPVYVAFGTTPTFLPETTSTIAIPSNAAPGEATLKVIFTDRAGRVFESTPVAFTIVNNGAPAIDTFVATPADEIYANRSIAVSATASDDVAVTALTLTSSIGTVTSQTATKPTPTTMARDFTVAIPKETASGTSIVLTLSATDGFPGRTPTTSALTVKVRKDEIAPVVTIAKPTPNQQFQETAGGTFDIEVTATDAEVAVQSVKATFDGTEYTLTPVTGRPGVYAKTGILLPDVEGTDPVAKSVTVTVTDYQPNTTTATVPFSIKPLVDPNAPKLSWICSSPNALYPAGYATTFSVNAIPAPTQPGQPANGVSKVEFSVDGGALIPATNTSGTIWTANYTVPVGAAAGTVLNVRAIGTSTSNASATLLGTITVVTGTNITTESYINADDTGYENASVIVKTGGTLIITGPHTLKDLVVLNGGKVVQKHLNIAKADLLTVDRLYVGCSASIDVTGQGYTRGTTYPGAGNPDDASGGSHIGRGGLWNHRPGGVFGSIYRPMEAGGGGHPYNASATGNGGGSVRIHATGSVTLDGSIAARGVNGTLGSSAGGSVWITTAGPLSGGGSINATGGDVTTGSGASGGGGSIALEYANVTGSLTANLLSRGGVGGQGRLGGAGSIYLKSTAAAFGDLIVNNSGVATTYGVTELPSFGRIQAASAAGNSVTLDATRWLSPAMAGHWVRVSAPDGTERGTWRIASVTNSTTTTPINGFHDIPTQDAFVYDGFVVYVPNGLGGKKFVAARYVTNRWEYDNDTTFTPFTPQSGDAVIASFTKDSSGITDVTTFNCTNACAPVYGMPVLEVVQGDIIPNSTGNGTSGNRWDLSVRDAAELFLRPDHRRRGIVLSDGANASITLADATGIEAGDLLRGIYRFDNVNVTNAVVGTEDLFESTTSPVLDGASSLVTGNLAAPAVTTANISITAGLNGPVVTGTAAAVTDPEKPIFVVARNTTRSTVTPPVLWNANPGQIHIGIRGGMSVARPLNGHTTQVNGTSSLKAITGSGFVSFSASQTNKTIMAGLAPADTTANSNEPGINGFKLLTTGSYELWASGANASKNGTYTTSTIFRIEKTPAAIRWFVNNAQVHEVTTSIPAKLILDISFQGSDSGEIHSIVYDTTTNDNGSYRIAAATDGSFKLPIKAQPGDEIVVSAWDSHLFTFRSAETTVATIGNDFGAESVTFSSNEITGGRTLVGTATIRSAAGSDGSLVTLASDSTTVTIPASVTIPAGQVSQTFTITTQPVLEAGDVAITATYSGVPATGTLRVLRDAAPPTITITSPAPNTQFNEGSATKIALQATVVDDDSGVSVVTATINGQTTSLAKDPSKGVNVWTAPVPSPFIDGTTPLTMDLTVNATDNNTNIGTAAVPVVIKPVVDGSAPTVTWVCSPSSTVIAGAATTLRVTATAPSGANPLQSVVFQIAGQPTLTATNVSGTTWEAQWNVPATDATYAVTALATVAGGASTEAPGTLIAAIVDKTYSASATLSDATWDGKTIAVTGGTLTISGTRTFRNVLIIGGGVVHPTGAPLTITTTGNFYVACGANIDLSSRGYGSNVSHPTALAPYPYVGGSHIGRGWPVATGYTYGSVYRPKELGSGGYEGAAGGGALRIDAKSVTLNGSIYANGGEHNRSGAGGSVWITTDLIKGAGTIEARGGRGYYEAGGGGAIAIEYTDAASVVPTTMARGGFSDRGAHGGPGSIYVKGPASTHGDLTLESHTDGYIHTAELPGLGKGVAQAGSSGATLVTDRTKDVQAYFVGHWVEIRSASGTLKGTWRVATVNLKTVTLAPNGTETIAVEPGDAWQGVYRFDSVRLNGSAHLTVSDPIRTPAVTMNGPTSGDWARFYGGLDAQNVIIKGRVVAPKVVADNVTVESGALITHDGTSASGMVVTTNTFTLNGTIDLSYRGYASNVSHPTALAPYAYVGGSHLGRGWPVGTGYTYGSVYRPQELGSGGYEGASGGGVLRIDAKSVTLNGPIYANGGEHNRSGAGGSVWITTDLIKGAGTIEARGGRGYYEAGGGGAIAIEYTDAASVLPPTTARGGFSDRGAHGGPGSIYVKGPASTHGDLTFESNTDAYIHTAELPGLGKGVAQAGSSGATLVTDRTKDVQAYFVGHWIEIHSAGGTLKGTWRVASVNAKTVTLAPNATETIAVEPGDAWQGVYRFDNVRLNGSAHLTVSDPIRTSTVTMNGPTTGDWARFYGGLDAQNVILKGRVVAPKVVADNVTVESGALITHDGTSASGMVVTTNTFTLNGTIDLSYRGYASNVSHPTALAPYAYVGGSHLGRGWPVGIGYTYDSVYRPQELGSGGYEGAPGGGVLRIDAKSVTLNGPIYANGGEHNRSGAGGSVWITTDLINGAGMIEARGGRGYYEAGGGGAIAIEYTDAASVVPPTTARGGFSDRGAHGGPGSIYVKGPASTHGDLTLESNTDAYIHTAELPGLGKGVAQAGSSGATLVTDRTKDVQAYFVGHWIEIHSSSGTLKGTWRVASVNAKTVTLAANATETIAVEPGDAWQGVYRFDSVRLNGSAHLTVSDPIRTSTATLNGPTSGDWARFYGELNAQNVILKGHAIAPKVVADNVTIESGATVTHDGTSASGMVVTTNTFTLNGTIDLTNRGYASNVSHPTAPAPYAYVGGSHLGRGYAVGAGYTYGSMYRPQELGGGGYEGAAGGGLLRIDANSVTLNGPIYANGGEHNRSGAGGSVWITTDLIKGAGTIEARGGRGYYECGGGGAITIEYTDAASVLPVMTARGGVGDRGHHGGPGSIYLKRPTSVYGDLIFENTVAGHYAELPSLGFGTAQTGTSGATVVTDRATNIPAYFAGHWVEIKSPGGTVKGVWRIASITGKSFTLAPNGTETIDIAAGDRWFGIYRVDVLKLRNAQLASGDRLDFTTKDSDAGSNVHSNDGPPQFPAAKQSQIVVQSLATGDSVIGPVGAVTDPHTPIRINVKNTRTAAVFQADAAANGSFSIPVSGIVGDTFTITATDSHLLPATSFPLAVNGAIEEMNRIASVTIRPESVVAGTGAVATIQLTNPARATGVVVELDSSSSAASLQNSVLIPGGATIAQVPIDTTLVASRTDAVITATLVEPKSATLTVTTASAGAVDITVADAQIEGGTSVDATVTLGEPAPAGDATIIITSSSPAATVPSTITIPEGGLSQTFTVTIAKVGAVTNATLSAAYGSSDSVDLEIAECQTMGTPSTPTSVPMKATWVNDAVPTGAAKNGDTDFATTQAATGTSSIYFPPPSGSAVRTFGFTGAAAFAVTPADTLVVYALVNPCDPPRQISVQWMENGTTSWTTNWGESRVNPTAVQYRAGAIPAGGEWVRLEVLAKDAGITANKNLTGLTIRVDGGEVWIDSVGTGSCVLPKQPKPEHPKFDTIWYDNALPAGAVSGCDVYTWDITQSASGSASVLIPNAGGLHQTCFTAATQPFTFDEGDVLYAYVLIDPCNPPREVMLQWHDGTAWNRRAYWGEDLINSGALYGRERLKMGNLPEAGKWVRLEVPAVQLGLEGASVRGMAFTLYDGRAWFDRAGKFSRVNVALGKTATQSSTEFGQVASHAVDGDPTTINHTASDTNSWLKIDLGAAYPIDNITIRNRTDSCCINRLRNFSVFVSEDDFTSDGYANTIAQENVFRYHYYSTVGGPVVDMTIKRTARYVRIQMGVKDNLNLREVQVWAAGGSGPINVAGGSKATSTTPYDNSTLPIFGVDGATHSPHGSGASIFHTITGGAQRFDTDLHKIQHISSIDIIRRPDPYEALLDYYVIVSDDEFESIDLATTLAQDGVSVYHFKNAVHRPIVINRTGRYVRIQPSTSGNNYIGFAELRIWSHGKVIGAMAKPAEGADTTH